jgi:beta-1,3-galactosyl-O-glycosyl-glycoprotein beta-1,6-N-acetylglucosaminyltransferase
MNRATEEIWQVPGSWTAVQTSLICMKDLLNANWRYVINLSEKDFPLKTNLEMIRALKARGRQN